jgi:CheY-like chemotaxis protein
MCLPLCVSFLRCSLSVCLTPALQIGLDTTAPDRAGATFHFGVRVNRVAPELAYPLLGGPSGAVDAQLAAATEFAENAALQGRRILLAAENDHVRAALVQAARRAGAEAVSVQSAARALALLGVGVDGAAPVPVAERAFDLVVIDADGMNTPPVGLEAARLLRASDVPAAGTPIVLLAHRSFTTAGAGRAYAIEVQEALSGGTVQAVVAKPVKASVMRRVWVDVLAQREAVNATLQPLRARLQPTAVDEHTLSSAARGLRVLVADDVTVNQRIVSLQLQKLGLREPRMAGDGSEALHAMLTQDFDLVLMYASALCLSLCVSLSLAHCRTGMSACPPWMVSKPPASSAPSAPRARSSSP